MKPKEPKKVQEKIYYGYSSLRTKIPVVFYSSYEHAKKIAELDDPDSRPYYIFKRTETYEIVDSIKKERTRKKTAKNTV